MDVTSETGRDEFRATFGGPSGIGTMLLSIMGWTKLVTAGALSVGRVFLEGKSTHFEAMVISALLVIAGCACLAAASLRRSEART